MLRYLNTGLLLALLTAASTALAAQPGGIRGIVSLDKTTKVKTAVFKLKQNDKTLKEIRVKNGRSFEIKDLPEGRYRLVVEAKLHTTYVEEDVTVGPGQIIEKTIRMIAAPFVVKYGPATRTILCSACHKAIYMEMIRGVGTEFYSGPWPDAKGNLIHLPEEKGADYYSNSSPERLAFVNPITVATIGRQPEDLQDGCRACHAPTLIHVKGKIRPPGLRKDNREDGVTCASCHVDENGSVHGKYDLSAPHPTVQDDRFTRTKSAGLCAACHQADRMAPNQQTVAEWKRDFAPRDPRTCRDCHMPPATRLLSEIFSDRPKREIGKHLFAGGHAQPILQQAAALMIQLNEADPRRIKLIVANTGAGHSIPTGYGPRAVIATFTVEDETGRAVPLPGFPNGTAAVYTVNTGIGKPEPFIEPAIRAGEIKELLVSLNGLPKGAYRVRAELRYDLDRTDSWNDRDLPLMAHTTAMVNLP